MASIIKKGENWYIVATVNGKSKWIKGKETKKETQSYLNEILLKLEKIDLERLKEQILLKDYINQWLNNYCKLNLKRKTVAGYKTYINNYINPRIGNMDLRDITPMDIQEFYYDVKLNGRIKSEEPLSNTTVIQMHRILRKALKTAVKMQIINTNPADYVDLPRKSKYKYEILKEKEIPEFLNKFKDTNIYTAILLAIYLGLRRGEILALTYKDIDFKNNIITVNKTLTVVNGIIKIDTTKTESSDREILMPENLKKYLYEEKIDKKRRDSEYIIQNSKGQLYNPGSFSRRYTELRQKLETKQVRFHDLRHTNATLMYNSGIETKVMQQRLGHSNISTTLDTYTHLFKENQKEAAEKLNLKIDLNSKKH